MTPELKAALEKMRDEKAENHLWSFNCTCAEFPDEVCGWNLDDAEKAKESYIKGFDAAMPIIEGLVEALEFYANKDNWFGPGEGPTPEYCEAPEDLEQVGTDLIGGKRARAVLAELEEL